MCFGTRILPVKSPPKKTKNKVVQKNKTIDSCVIKDALGVINYPIYIYIVWRTSWFVLGYPKLVTWLGRESGCGSKRCSVCPFLKKTQNFSDKAGKGYNIRAGSMNCNYKNLVYLVSSASTSFRLRFNNYKCQYRKHISGSTVTQASLFAHFAQTSYNGMDWEFVLIDQAENLPLVRRKESFWQYISIPFHLMGLMSVMLRWILGRF